MIKKMQQFKQARLNMVEGQIRPNKVTDERIIEAMLALPREIFVPKTHNGYAYLDDDIEIMKGRYLLEPRILARLIQAAEITSDDVILDIGCATGYSTVILSHLAAMVVGLEDNKELAARAMQNLTALEADNAAIIEANIEVGYPEQAPYDVIIFNGAVAEMPMEIIDQLADGGRLLYVEQKNGCCGKAMLIRKNGDNWSSKPLFDATTPFLPKYAPKPVFEF